MSDADRYVSDGERRLVASTARTEHQDISALKTNPLPDTVALPVVHDDTLPHYYGPRVIDAGGGEVCECKVAAVRAHIAAAVNAAPVLLARVADLEAQLDAIREVIAFTEHPANCAKRWAPGEVCGCTLDEACIILGLEVTP